MGGYREISSFGVPNAPIVTSLVLEVKPNDQGIMFRGMVSGVLQNVCLPPTRLDQLHLLPSLCLGIFSFLLLLVLRELITIGNMWWLFFSRRPEQLEVWIEHFFASKTFRLIVWRIHSKSGFSLQQCPIMAVGCIVTLCSFPWLGGEAESTWVNVLGQGIFFGPGMVQP